MTSDQTAKRRAAYESGLVAEKAAAAYLRGKGFTLIAERYKNAYGEIDLLMRDGEYLVAVEVKKRADMQSALESVRPKAQKRIQNALMMYIANNPHERDSALRFDVVAIVPPCQIHHLDNAWQAQL